MSTEQAHSAIHAAILALGKPKDLQGLALLKALEALQVTVLSGNLPAVANMEPEEYQALVDFTGKVRNDVELPDVAAYLLSDYLASELGYDLVPVMGPRCRKRLDGRSWAFGRRKKYSVSSEG